MKDNKLPTIVNPMNQLMLNGMSGMPGLPDIIAKAMPVHMPQANFNQNFISLGFGNFKRKQIAKASDMEAQISRNSLETVKNNLEAMHTVLTFSARYMDTMHEYEHRHHMRGLLEERCTLENEGLVLENKKKEAEVFKIQAEASIAGWEAKLSEMDYETRAMQVKKMREEV
jgi:hypothetical protein